MIGGLGRRPLWGAVSLVAAALTSYSFYQGWTRSESDFPNYYTAAVLVRKGAALRNFYDWPWFQREMEYAGVAGQLGGYIPQTPVTMLPMVPLASLSVQWAKRAWLLADLVFLGGTLWLLTQITGFALPQLLALLVAGFGALHTNLLLGQYYVFLLFLLTAAAFCLRQERSGSSGFFLGLAFGLKLLTGPFLLYFAVKRQWRAVAGMITAVALLGVVALALFGWNDVVFYLAHILPRSLSGETLDPYNPGNGTLTTLLRRTFVSEPELNPKPFFGSPWLFFYFRSLLTLSVLGLSMSAFARRQTTKTKFSCFLITLLLLSPNTASYTFLLLLLPTALLLSEAKTMEKRSRLRLATFCWRCRCGRHGAGFFRKCGCWPFCLRSFLCATENARAAKV